MWTSRHADALRTTFDALNATGLTWMVLRNYEGLPDSNRAKDIDLLLDKKDFRRAHQVIGAALAAHGFNACDEMRLQYVHCSTFFNVSADGLISIKIDLLDGFAWRGAQVFSFSELFASHAQHRNLRVPDKVHDAFMLWVKPLMTGGIVKQSYRADILQGVRDCGPAFRQLTQDKFGKHLADQSWPHLQSGRLDETVRFKSALRRAAWLRAFRKAPAQTIASAGAHVFWEVLRRMRRPKASMFAVIGPDGSGKSTFVELLRSELSRCLVKDAQNVQILHFRPNMLPNLKKLFSGAGYDESQEQFSDPHRAHPANQVSSLFRQIYYWLDYVLGYWLFIRRGCVAGRVYIFDRYSFDFVVDPHRSRISLPHAVRYHFALATPQPDLVFFLEANAKVIHERKQELTLAEIERQNSVYRSLAAGSARFVTLDATQSSAEMCSAALNELVKRSF